MSKLATGQVIDWAAQDVRVTIFAAKASMRIDDLFAAAFLERPMNYQDAQMGVGPSQAQASGTGPIGQLLLLSGPGRFDVVVQPPITPPNSPPETAPGNVQHPLITNKNVDAAKTTVIEAAIGILNEFESINRLAVSIGLAKTAATHQSANALLNEILPYSIVLGEESDFTLQSNAKSMLQNPRAEINSFSSWSVTAVQQVNVIANMSNNFRPAPAQLINLYYMAQKVIDINTMPDGSLFSARDAESVLRSLLSRLNTLMTIS